MKNCLFIPVPVCCFGPEQLTCCALDYQVLEQFRGLLHLVINLRLELLLTGHLGKKPKKIAVKVKSNQVSFRLIKITF